MLIEDSKKMFTIKFDKTRRIAHETPVGLWTAEDYRRYHNEYVTKIATVLEKKPWAKLTDLRKYKTSSITEEMDKHTEWMAQVSCKCVALIVESAIVKSQLNRVIGGKFEQQAFTDEKEALDWLKSKGF